MKIRGESAVVLSNTEVSEIEHHLHIQLPTPYREALMHSPLPADSEYVFEFVTSVSELIGFNEHFLVDNADDVSHLYQPGIFGLIRGYLMYGSKSRQLALKHAWIKEWKIPQRFIIGTDGGEIQYFILLTEDNPKIYQYCLETGEVDVASNSIAEWMVEIKERAAVTD